MDSDLLIMDSDSGYTINNNHILNDINVVEK